MRISIIFVLILLVGCGKNAHVTAAPAQSTGTDGSRPQNPDPTPTPSAQIIKIEINHRQFDDDEKEFIQLPYKLKRAKIINPSDTTASILCRLGDEDFCVKNKQVVFAFDIAREELPHFDLTSIRDIKLNLNLYSLFFNFKTEMICFLNNQACSGKGIGKKSWRNPLGWVIHKRWRNKDFWRSGEENIIKNFIFKDLLMAHFRWQNRMYVMRDVDFSMKDLFGFNNQQLKEFAYNLDTFHFVITDDTFTSDPKLIIELETTDTLGK